MKNYLLEQFNSTYDKKAWFVSLKDAVKDLTEEQAHQKPNADINSIYELVTHLVFWNERYLQKYHHEQLGNVNDNDDTFKNPANHSWPELLQKADEIFTAWQSELGKIDGAARIEDKDDWNSLIGHINTHNAYHIGQIVVLSKLQGSWDKTKGVN